MIANTAQLAPLVSLILPGPAEVSTSQLAAEPAVWGLLCSGRWVRLLGRTDATEMFVAGWEIGLSLDTDGQWRLSWLPDTDVLEIEIRPPV